MNDKITFKCIKCGSTDFEIPTNPKANDMITCVGCGSSGRYTDVQKQAMNQAEKAVNDMLGDAFKGFK